MYGAVDITVIEPDPNEEAMRAVKQGETMRKTTIGTLISIHISHCQCNSLSAKSLFALSRNQARRFVLH